MNINIIIAVNNEIHKEGLTSIIQNGILGSNVVKIDKENLLNKIQSNFFDIAIVEIRKKNKNDFELVNAIIKIYNKTKIFFFINNDIDSKIANIIKFNNLDFFSSSDATITITKKLKFHFKYHINKSTFRKRKKNKLTSLNNLLSNRELEIGSMLIKGYSISKIALNKNLAKSTVSTYKRRIFEKTNVNNIIDMIKIFNDYQQKMNND